MAHAAGGDAQPHQRMTQPNCTVMSLRSHGYCEDGFYAGWVTAEATHDACMSLCLSEPQCRYAALYEGNTCSRYDAGAGRRVQ